MNITFCIDNLGLVGLGSALSSLLRNCSKKNNLKFWFFCNEINVKDNISKLLNIENFKGDIEFIDINPLPYFKTWKSLHGNYTTYIKLLIPNYVTKESKVLYLDSDLIINFDIFTLNTFEFNGFPIAAVKKGQLQYTYDHDFYINTLLLPSNAPTFNAGVILFNIVIW